MAIGTISSFMTMLLGGDKAEGPGAGGAAGPSGGTTEKKKAPKGTDTAGVSAGAGGAPQEGGGISNRPEPGAGGPQGRQSPTTRFPFGSSILGEGRSLFPDVSVAGGSSSGRDQQATSGSIRTKRKKTGFGIA